MLGRGVTSSIVVEGLGRSPASVSDVFEDGLTGTVEVFSRRSLKSF
ncbi:MAG: hypothetical protein ACSHXY_10705 [Alphaproteobacteria bacterium]